MHLQSVISHFQFDVKVYIKWIPKVLNNIYIIALVLYNIKWISKVLINTYIIALVLYKTNHVSKVLYNIFNISLVLYNTYSDPLCYVSRQVAFYATYIYDWHYSSHKFISQSRA
jgi:hypothetical protein